MAVAEQKVDVPGITRPMTYEEYMAGPEEMARYDIIDGWKIYRLYGDKLMPSPTRRHQTISLNLAEAFRAFQRREKQGEVFIAPCDVQITYQPLKSRQPDLLFISHDRLAQNAPSDEYSPLSPAPELVVEIVSPADTPTVLSRKLDDYRTVDVQEIWLVDTEIQQITVMPSQLEQDVTAYGIDHTAVSIIFPDLIVNVSDIFQE